MSVSSDVPSAPLRGWLFKRGEKGLTKGWKKRWFQQVGNEICYYVNKDASHTRKGSIRLDVLISVHPDPHQKGNGGRFGFKINTPRRAYELLAENELMMTYWVTGLVRILKDGLSANKNHVDITNLQLQVEDLMLRNKQLELALALACQKASTTVSHIMAELDHPEPSITAPDIPIPFQQFQAKVLYDFTATRVEQLSLSVGTILIIEGKHEGGWWSGVDPQGRRGFFPGSYLCPQSIT